MNIMQEIAKAVRNWKRKWSEVKKILTNKENILRKLIGKYTNNLK